MSAKSSSKLWSCNLPLNMPLLRGMLIPTRTCMTWQQLQEDLEDCQEPHQGCREHQQVSPRVYKEFQACQASRPPLLRDC